MSGHTFLLGNKGKPGLPLLDRPGRSGLIEIEGKREAGRFGARPSLDVVFKVNSPAAANGMQEALH
jgi:hypothetical protein